MATGTTAAAASDAPDRGCASPSPEGVVPVGPQRSDSAMVCAPCVARPSPLPERVAAIQPAIAAEVEPLVTLTQLLQLCRDEHAVPWERVNDPVGPGDQLAEILADVRAVLPVASSVAVLNPEVRCALAGALTASRGVLPVLVAHALAEVIDERYAHSFAGSFSRRSPYRPCVGDPIPLDSPDLRQVTVLSGTSPPWRLANRLDETRHVRLADERVRAGVDVIAEIRAMAASSPIIDEQSLNHTPAPLQVDALRPERTNHGRKPFEESGATQLGVRSGRDPVGDGRSHVSITSLGARSRGDDGGLPARAASPRPPGP